MRKFTLEIFGLCALTLAPLPALALDSNSEGIKAFRAGDYAKAERMYIQALTEESDKTKVASIYRNLSVLYNAQGKDGAEFLKKADQLDPPITPMVVKDKNGDVLIYNGGKHAATPINQEPPNTSPQASASPNQGPPRRYSGNPADGSTPPFFSGSKMYSEYTNSQIGGGFNFNPGRGGFNGGFNARSYSASPLPFYYGPQLGGIQYSNVGPNGAYGFSEGTPIVLPVPNSLPVILNAPGPNVYSNRRGPDGSDTTFMLRTE